MKKYTCEKKCGKKKFLTGPDDLAPPVMQK